MTRAAEGAARLTARCYAGLDAGSLQDALLDGLQRIVPFDAAFCATVDPATLLFTGAALRDIPWESTPRFLPTSPSRTTSTSSAPLLRRHRRWSGWTAPPSTVGRPASATARSWRRSGWATSFGSRPGPAGRAGGSCACPPRRSQRVTPQEAQLIARLSTHVGEGLRRGLLTAAAATGLEPEGPGVLVVAEDGSLVATTAAGERWLWELDDGQPNGAHLAVAVQAVLARLVSNQTDNPPIDQPSVRLRTRSGRWVVVHASKMDGLNDGQHVAVVIEPAKPAELAPIILLAHGLTRREGQVAQLALQGKTNKRVARRLRISEHTVEDHLKAIFTKVGVSTRGELAARIFTEHYTH